MTGVPDRPSLETAVAQALAMHGAGPGPLLQVLHAVQDRLGWIPDEGVALIAEGLNLSRAEVHGVVTFYQHFRRTPPGRHVIQLCRAEACQSMGARALEAHAVASLGVGFHQITPDGSCTLLPVACLGNCALSPAVTIDGQIHGRVTPDRFDTLVHELTAGPAGSQAAGRGPEVATISATRLFVSADAAGQSVGADETAAALAGALSRMHVTLPIARPGSRGLCWLEPLVEVEQAGRRYAFGPVRADDVTALIDAGLLAGGLLEPSSHPLALGETDALPWLRRQTRLTFARVGVIDPLSLDEYRAHGGGLGLERALAMTPAAVVEAVTASGLRGRGGAAFPTGVKWQTVLAQSSGPGEPKYIACNADEGDSGTFADRMLMEGDPFALIEGMVIAGLAVGATQGYIYLRVEYPQARATLEQAIARAYAGGLLGVLPGGRRFDLEVRLGAGAYICGEETSMLESLEGKRGEVRSRPPLPAVSGLFGRPTVVNNVLSLATVPWILAHGAAAYQAFGSGRSRGTLAVQLGGNVRRGGLFEVPFGLPLREVIEEMGGGTASGRPVRAVQVGGPLGAYLPVSQLDTPLDYEAFTAIGALLGHGGVVVFDDTVDMVAMTDWALRFCADESCGKCTPCRIGSTRGAEAIERLRAGEEPERNLALVEELCHTLQYGSLCGLGGLTPYPVRSAITHFRADFLAARAPAHPARPAQGGRAEER